jgi:hypothetical protein
MGLARVDTLSTVSTGEDGAMSDDERWLRAGEVADRWGCHRSYVVVLAERHDVRVRQLNRQRRYHEADVDAVAREMRAKAGGPQLGGEELTARRWRVGGSWGLTIVAEGYDKPTGDPEAPYRREDDVPLGMMREADVARHIVRLHNASLPQEPEGEE